MRAARARACLLALARLVFLSATAWVAMAEVLLTLFICGRLLSGRVTQEPHPGYPFAKWVRIREAFHALRRLVCRFTTGWPESFWRLRASAKRRSML